MPVRESMRRRRGRASVASSRAGSAAESPLSSSNSAHEVGSTCFEPTASHSALASERPRARFRRTFGIAVATTSTCPENRGVAFSFSSTAVTVTWRHTGPNTESPSVHARRNRHDAWPAIDGMSQYYAVECACKRLTSLR
eukprot:scaffold148994_cov31-Tisochrysis_lutea.AAC.3